MGAEVAMVVVVVVVVVALALAEAASVVGPRRSRIPRVSKCLCLPVLQKCRKLHTAATAYKVSHLQAERGLRGSNIYIREKLLM